MAIFKDVLEISRYFKFYKTSTNKAIINVLLEEIKDSHLHDKF